MMGNNPNIDLVNINVFTTFGKKIISQDIENNKILASIKGITLLQICKKMLRNKY